MSRNTYEDMSKFYLQNPQPSIEFKIIINEMLNCAKNNKAFLALANDYESGAWRTERFVDYIFNHLSLCALSQRERMSVPGACTELKQSIKSLRKAQNTDEIPSTEYAEIGEILLYGIMQDYYGALPVVPKIFYKQNQNDYAKGFDSVHIVVESEDCFSLWLGESKFYNNFDDGFNAAIKSIKENLGDGDKIKRECRILLSLEDRTLLLKDHEQLNQRIEEKLYYTESLDNMKELLHIPILILHECEITKSSNDNSGYFDHIKDEYTSKFNKVIEKLNDSLRDIYHINSICFHMIVFPISDKAHLQKQFQDRIRRYE